MYSISTILIALLLSAGIGSTASDVIPLKNTRAALPFVILGVGLMLLFESFASPFVFERFLGLSFYGRVAVACALLAPLGFLMGMPFSLGMRLINTSGASEAERKKLIAWAWGMNGYATVIGSAATVFLALVAGFQAVLLLAVLVYAAGCFAVLHGGLGNGTASE